MRLLDRSTELLPGYPGDAEALIREARRLRRRRWTIGIAVALSIVAGLLAGVVTAKNSSIARPPTAISLVFGPTSPTVNAKGFVSEGELAFVSRKTLYVLDGTTGSLRRLSLPSGYVASDPAFSRDHKWLAFVATRIVNAPNGVESTLSALWVAESSGAGLRRLTGFTNPALVGWSPTADLLAVTNQGKIPTTYLPPLGSGYVSRQTSLWLVSPDGQRRELVRPDAGEIDGAAWSPDGSSLAVSRLSAYPFQDHEPWSATLISYPISGSHPTVWLEIVNPRSDSCCVTANLKQSEFIPAGWWNKWGVVFWAPSALIDPSLTGGGGFSLYALPASGEKPILLGDTLEGNQVSPIVASPNGELAITNEPDRNDGARPFWQNEQVEWCDPTTLRCSAIPEPRGTISFDPIWSPDGSTLAYLVGAVSTNGGLAQSVVSRWYNSLQLRLYSEHTQDAVTVAAARGAVAPLWSASGKQLLYVENDGLWLLKRTTGQPVEIAGPLLPAADWNAYYAQIDWSGLFSWSSH